MWPFDSREVRYYKRRLRKEAKDEVTRFLNRIEAISAEYELVHTHARNILKLAIVAKVKSDKDRKSTENLIVY